jgi:hypothetical protein
MLLFILIFATSLAAQPLTVGTQITDAGGTATITSGGPVSYIDLAHPATAAGVVNEASVSWSKACSGAFKVVFLRNTTLFLTSFTVVATRGPFNAVSGRNEVTFSPVTLQEGDLIGVVQLQSLAACGSVRTQFLTGGGGYNLVTTGDISAGGVVGSSANYSGDFEFAAVAYTSAPVLVRILPAAGAVQGSSAFFRTSLQMLNPGSLPLSGKLVFHPQGQSAKPADPSLPFTIASGHTFSSADVITAMGASGLGSLDVLTNGSALPIVSARVFSDGGAVAGTTGFSEEGVPPNAALDFVSTGLLLIPTDLANFRMNIGVRTLDDGATISIAMFDANGNVRTTRSVTYSANYFEQKPVGEFTGASTVEPGGWLSISTTFPGRIIIYSSVIDNRTSDSTYHLANVK